MKYWFWIVVPGLAIMPLTLIAKNFHSGSVCQKRRSEMGKGDCTVFMHFLCDFLVKVVTFYPQ